MVWPILVNPFFVLWCVVVGVVCCVLCVVCVVCWCCVCGCWFWTPVDRDPLPGTPPPPDPLRQTAVRRTPSAGPPCAGPPPPDRPKFRFLFTSPSPISFFSCLSDAAGASQPENSKRAHGTSKTPPKFNEKTPRERQKERNGGGRVKKKREISGLPAFRAPRWGPFPLKAHHDAHQIQKWVAKIGFGKIGRAKSQSLRGRRGLVP